MKKLSEKSMKILHQWLLGDDVGISSKTIASVVLGVKPYEHDHPYDPSDFGRCHRLLEAVPEIEAMGFLEDVAKKYPSWKYLVQEWPNLTDLYIRDLPSGRSGDLYRNMKYLIDKAKAFKKGGNEAVAEYDRACESINFTINANQYSEKSSKNDVPIYKYPEILKLKTSMQDDVFERKVLVIWKPSDGALEINGERMDPQVIEVNSRGKLLASVLDFPVQFTIGDKKWSVKDSYHYNVEQQESPRKKPSM